MARSTKAEKARQLNAALGLLQRHIALPEAVQMQLVTQSSIYQSVKRTDTLEEASAELDRPLELTEATVPITLKLPPSTVQRLRKYARSSGLTIGAIVTVALNAFLRTLKRNG